MINDTAQPVSYGDYIDHDQFAFTLRESQYDLMHPYSMHRSVREYLTVHLRTLLIRLQHFAIVITSDPDRFQAEDRLML